VIARGSMILCENTWTLVAGGSAFEVEIMLRERGPVVAVNPGIPPAIVAAAVGRRLRTFEVRPRILAGTAQIPGAVEVRSQDLRQGRAQRTQATVRETQKVIQPSRNVPRAQPLAAGEQGRLGDNLPRAARGREPTTGQGPAGGNQQQQRQQQQGQKQQPDQPQQPGMQGRRPDQQQQGAQGRGPQQKQPPQGTEGRAPQQKRPPQATEGRAPQQKQPPQATEGRGGGQQKQ